MVEKITEDFNDDLRTTDWLNPNDPASIILDERKDGKKTKWLNRLTVK